MRCWAAVPGELGNWLVGTWEQKAGAHKWRRWGAGPGEGYGVGPGGEDADGAGGLRVGGAAPEPREVRGAGGEWGTQPALARGAGSLGPWQGVEGTEAR